MMKLINGATVSATSVRKSWTQIVKNIIRTKTPTYVLSNNVPEVVIVGYEDYQEMQRKLEEINREELGKQIIQEHLEELEEFVSEHQHDVIDTNENEQD